METLNQSAIVMKPLKIKYSKIKVHHFVPMFVVPLKIISTKKMKKVDFDIHEAP